MVKVKKKIIINYIKIDINLINSSVEGKGIIFWKQPNKQYVIKNILKEYLISESDIINRLQQDNVKISRTWCLKDFSNRIFKILINKLIIYLY